MAHSRNISNITQNRWHNGFLGAGHKALAVLDGTSYKTSDPFILFMDDKLDIPGGEPVGGPHPHAGFETLTLVLESNTPDWPAGSFELMTAGKGIIHTEEISTQQKLRILQVWLVLPPEKRNVQPQWQRILLEDVPKIKTNDYELRVYSGSSNGVTSPLTNFTPLTLVEYKMKKHIEIIQEIPAHYNGLVYVLNGSAQIGEKIISAGQTGWLSQTGQMGSSEIILQAMEADTHFVFYAGQPHQVPVFHHGPFVADSMQDIATMYKEFRSGSFPHLNDLPAEQKFTYSL